MPRSSHLARAIVTAVALLGALLPAAAPVAAAENLTMDARVLLEGNTRVGAWMAIEVRLVNDGPAIVGELRLTSSQDARTRFGTPVDLPTTSDKVYVLYAQPPSSFGSTIKVSLIADGAAVAERTVEFTVTDPSRLVVGVVAERPEAIIPNLQLQPGGNNDQPPTVVSLELADLPDRVEAWASLDRLIWQDVDSVDLTTGQIAALRGWLAGGGRLIVVGGTAGPASLSSFPDDILPYRPTATVDVPPDTLTGLIGQLPDDAADLPVLAGELVRGRALASNGDRTIAAESAYGSGVVTLLGFDPTTTWIVESDTTEGFWRRFIPPRSGGGGGSATNDDGQLVNAVSQLPNLALPPIGGLLVLLFGYILLIGPVNYLVLRRLDRREWAWITMPVLIAVFAAGSYGFGAALRGLDVVINEVAIVRGAPGATEGTAQVYLGVFSPSRGTYQLEVPGGALLSSTITGEFINSGSAGILDVIQGETARVRDLTIGFGSLRTLRAETAATVPLIETDLVLENGTLKGTITNRSEETLEQPAVVLGSSVVALEDLAPGTTQTIALVVRPNQFGDSLSNRILGQIFFGDPRGNGTSRNVVRHAVLDHLTFDASNGSNSQLRSENPVLLAWGVGEVLDIAVSGQAPRRTGNVLYYLPMGMRVQGTTAFHGDLIRSSVVEVDGGFFTQDPFSINMGRGSATIAYRPIAFDGELTATKVTFNMQWGGEQGVPAVGGLPIGPMDPQPCRDAETDPPDCVEVEPLEPCDPTIKECEFREELPAVELFDRTGSGQWLRLPKLEMGATYDLADPGRYVDPGSGTLLVRFVNDVQDGMVFGFQVRIEGEVS